VKTKSNNFLQHKDNIFQQLFSLNDE